MTKGSLNLCQQTYTIMAKDTLGKDHPVVDALKKLKDEEVELITKLKPVQEAISALEKIVDKTVKKAKPVSVKENALESVSEENLDAQEG
jgi:hypothetical protein